MKKAIKTTEQTKSENSTEPKNVILEGKFFLIVDGDDGICLVGVSPPTVRYLTKDTLEFVSQQLDIKTTDANESLPIEEITARLSGRYLHPDVLVWMKNLREMSTSATTSEINMHGVRACIKGAEPIELIVGRGVRANST